MTRVLALDLSIKATGVAMPDGQLSTIETTKELGDRRIVQARDAIRGDLAANGGWPDLVVIEDTVLRSGSASLLGMLHGVVRADLIDRGIAYLLVSPATVKVYATGDGRADKPDLRMELYKRTHGRLDVRDDNQCDAWWMRALGLDLAGEPVVDLPQKHRRALAKLQLPAGLSDRHACTSCGEPCRWVDDAWVCTSCGDEWYPDRAAAG